MHGTQVFLRKRYRAPDVGSWDLCQFSRGGDNQVSLYHFPVYRVTLRYII